MKSVIILGGGTAGTMVANRLAATLDPETWNITLIDKDADHYYQPGFLFVPFKIYPAHEVVKPKQRFLPARINVLFSDIERIDPVNNRVHLIKDWRILSYDYLIIATGTAMRPEITPGLMGAGWRNNIFDFYSLDGAKALITPLAKFNSGRLVINVGDMPVKAPIAALEFAFLADWYFCRLGLRNKVEIVLATPPLLPQKHSHDALCTLLKLKGIHLVEDFRLHSVDAHQQVIYADDNREIGYDLLVSVPAHAGADYIKRSGLGDALNYVPTDPYTLQSRHWDNIFVIGDATDVPTMKLGSVAHFMVEPLIRNLLRHMAGQPVQPEFDGHTNCFVETGFNKGIMLDFNYENEPQPGTHYPVPGVGPFTLFKESPANHKGKMTFRWLYWNVILNGQEASLGSLLTTASKYA